MIRRSDVYKIGVLNKPHGIHGELQFSFNDDIFDRVEAEYIICMMDGILVPFFIEEYRFRSESSALIKLEGINSAEQARRFTNVEVYFPTAQAEAADDGEISWNFFVGFEVFDVIRGRLGEITYIDNSTINTLFVIDFNGEELLIPAQEDFIIDIDSQAKTIRMKLPMGLLTLEEAEEEE
ncbi:MAG: 16S rRNA processing protein RimM [Mediterranea massiliensis]|nr:16S rRNA processing protein RimM [Mediterranea massiliensis]